MQLTRRAILLLLITAALIALATWLPVMWLAAFGYLLLVLALLVLDGRLAEPAGRIELRREHAEKLSLGIENRIILHVSNHGRRTLHFALRDEPPDEFTVSQRLFGGSCAPRQEWSAAYTVTPLNRGVYAFGDFSLRWQGPLGLLVRQQRIAAAGSVKVYPNLLDVQRYDLLLKRNRLQEMGLRHSRQRGEGTEYERLREYLPDDDFRRIDWKATARRNRPITVEYETERSQNVFLAIDTGRMMQSPVERISKLDYVINASLLLTYVATGKGDKVGLMTFADQIGTFLSPGQGKGQFYKALEVLYAVRPEPVEPDYHYALNYLALKQRRRSLIVLFTDISSGAGMDALAAHAALLRRTNLVLIVTISDPDVVEAAQLRPSNSLEAYQRAAAGQILEERRLALDRLRQQGSLVLDAPANRLSTDVINRYLELKAQTLL
jgi:uncharacterized protein (DUF58 family)